MASLENREVFVVDTGHRSLFHCCLGAGLAMALSPAAAKEDQYQVHVPDRRHRIHGQ